MFVHVEWVPNADTCVQFSRSETALCLKVGIRLFRFCLGRPHDPLDGIRVRRYFVSSIAVQEFSNLQVVGRLGWFARVFIS